MPPPNRNAPFVIERRSKDGKVSFRNYDEDSSSRPSGPQQQDQYLRDHYPMTYQRYNDNKLMEGNPTNSQSNYRSEHTKTESGKNFNTSKFAYQEQMHSEGTF